MYYAMCRPYGTGTMSKDDALLRFATRRERDEWVAADDWDGSNFHRIAVTRRLARQWFPRAFKDIDWTNGDPDWEFWNDDGVWEREPTGGSYRYMR